MLLLLLLLTVEGRDLIGYLNSSSSCGRVYPFMTSGNWRKESVYIVPHTLLPESLEASILQHIHQWAYGKTKKGTLKHNNQVTNT